MYWEWLEHEWAPVQEFIKAVESGETPSTELLKEVAEILRVRVTAPRTKRKPGATSNSGRRIRLFERIIDLRGEGMSATESIEVASKEHHFDPARVREWFDQGRYADERNMAQPDSRLEWINEIQDLLAKYPAHSPTSKSPTT